MSDKLLIEDIQRVQSRIARLRQRTGKHALQMTDLPALRTIKSFQSLGQSWFATKKTPAAPATSGWLSLVIVLAGWYFSQPEAAHKLWEKLFAYWHAWRTPADSSSEESSASAAELNETPAEISPTEPPEKQ